MVQELLEQNILFWFQFLGALIAFVLGILKISEYWKKRVSLNIKLEQDNFISRQMPSGGDENYNQTFIDINVDLQNTGLEPTTLVGVDFYSDYEPLNNIEMTTRMKYTPIGIFRNFDDIRIEPNDRKIFQLNVSKDILLSSDIKELKAKLIFKITHKDISKKIKLIRKFE